MEDETKVQEVPEVFTEFPPVWTDPGTGEQYAMNQDNRQVEPNCMEERKGTILGSGQVQNFVKMQSKIHQKCQQILKEENHNFDSEKKISEKPMITAVPNTTMYG